MEIKWFVCSILILFGLNLSESFCFLFFLKREVLVFLSSSALAFSYALFQEKTDRNLLSGVEPSNFLEDNVRSKLELSAKHFHHQLKSKTWLLNPKFVILNYILIKIIHHSWIFMNKKFSKKIIKSSIISLSIFIIFTKISNDILHKIST